MSTQSPAVPKHRSHRQTRSAALPASVAPSQKTQNPLQINQYAQPSDTLCNMERTQHPTTPPRTPQKPIHNPTTTHKNQLSGSESVSKPRSRAKNRARNTVASPAVSRNDRRTPPLTAVQSGISSSIGQVSTPTATAYAGPTFHASPAPSTLPIPSFLSKSVPDSPGIKGLQSGTEETSSGGDESPTRPVANSILAQPQREESPLDFFFKADREEKARARSASSFHASRTESGPFPPPHNSPRTSHNTPPPGSEGHNRATHFSGGSTSALFAMELDGTCSPSKPYGPAFSTSYHERINAARSPPAPVEPTAPSSQELPKSTDMSEALKAFLFLPKTQGPPVPRPGRSPGDTLSTSARQQEPDPVVRSVSNSSVPQRGNGNSPWSQQNSFSHLNNSGTSRHSPRAGSRSSGLRQEFMVTETSTPAPEQASLPDLVQPSFLQSSKHDQSIKSINLPKTSSVSAPLQVSVSPSGMQSGSQPAEFKQMEDSLRRILKLEPVSNSGA